MGCRFEWVWQNFLGITRGILERRANSVRDLLDVQCLGIWCAGVMLGGREISGSEGVAAESWEGSSRIAQPFMAGSVAQLLKVPWGTTDSFVPDGTSILMGPLTQP